MASTVWSIAGETGISRDKTMHDLLMYMSNDDKQNYSFCRLKLLIENFQPTNPDLKVPF